MLALIAGKALKELAGFQTCITDAKKLCFSFKQYKGGKDLLLQTPLFSQLIYSNRQHIFKPDLVVNITDEQSKARNAKNEMDAAGSGRRDASALHPKPACPISAKCAQIREIRG